MLETGFDATLALARHGDETAFATIYRDLQPMLLRFLRVSAPHVYEDVAAETWLEVSAGIQRFSGSEAGFRAWVFTIARHRAIDAARMRSRRPEDSYGSLIDLPEGTTAGPGAQLEEVQATESAIRLVRTLPPEQGEAVLLRVVAGLTNAQVGEVLGKSNGAVRVLVHRGLRQLAASVELQTTSCNASRRGVAS